ncbi:hypothetical protein F4677DRAFT_294497 [Hypoxylon crocopeplum]|nr:hypothetical protein F4677DRAFT_294497 [Hypoxylon crocopeplum]
MEDQAEDQNMALLEDSFACLGIVERFPMTAYDMEYFVELFSMYPEESGNLFSIIPNIEWVGKLLGISGRDMVRLLQTFDVEAASDMYYFNYAFVDNEWELPHPTTLHEVLHELLVVLQTDAEQDAALDEAIFAWPLDAEYHAALFSLKVFRFLMTYECKYLFPSIYDVRNLDLVTLATIFISMLLLIQADLDGRYPWRVEDDSEDSDDEGPRGRPLRRCKTI